MSKHALVSGLVALAATFIQIGCSGSEGDDCASSAECRGELFCRGPDEPQVCGIAPREGCGSNDACFDGTRCHAIDDICSPDGVGSECGVDCTQSACNPGFRCNADGACEAIPCDEGDGCADHEMCDPTFDANTPVHARTDGCRAIACSDDGECPKATVCVNGRCQSGIGFCREPELIP